MSLINNMLQDLEKRRASVPEMAGVPRHVRVLPAARERRTGVAILLSVGLALAVATAWHFYKQIPTKIDRAVSSPLSAPPQSPELSRAASLQSARPTPRAESVETPAPVQSAAPVATASVVAAEPAAASDITSSPRAASRVEERPRPAPRAGIAADTLSRSADAPVALSLRLDAMPSERASVEPRASSHSGIPHIDRKVRELTPSQLAENEYRAGTNLLNQGRGAEAQERFANALRYVPSHVGARQGLFGLLLQAKKLAEAEHVLQEALKLDIAQPGFAMALARMQVDRGDAPAAVDTLQATAHAAQTNPDYLAFLAALLQRQGRHVNAVEMYQAALGIAPRSGIWLMGLGLSLQALNRNGEAQDAFRRARAGDGMTGELQAFVDQRLRQLQ